MKRALAGLPCAAAWAALAVSAALTLWDCGGGSPAAPEVPKEKPAPLKTWSFSGRTITYKSGFAAHGRDIRSGAPVKGIDVWLTDRDVSCAVFASETSVHRDAWVQIRYPFSVPMTAQARVSVGNWPADDLPHSGNIDVSYLATLHSVDTVSAREISGSLDLHEAPFDSGGWGAADVSGSFTVPYCDG